MIGYAIGGWRRSTPTEDAQTFSMHRAAQYGAVVGVLVFLILVETAGLHLILMHRAPIIAWLATSSSLWIALWLIADAQALRLEPLRLTSDGIQIIIGMRWRVFIRYDQIASIATIDNRLETPDTLSAGVIQSVNVQITLQQPGDAFTRSATGRPRAFTRLELTVDRGAEFVAAVASAVRPT